MGLTEQVAIVSLSSRVSFGEVAKVSAAIQKQVTRDFGPIWGISATVDSFERLEDVPIGSWVVMIIDHDRRLPSNAGGVHLDENGQPFALVRGDAGWPLTTSHEVLEMLADPFGNRIVAGESPAAGQGRVEFLVEVSDPSEASDFGYNVNGVLLSDFYTPNYFDPVVAPGVRYSFTGAIKRPREVLQGGYLSWHDPVSDHWFQWQYFGTSTIVDLGRLTLRGSLRATIERQTNDLSLSAMSAPVAALTAARAVESESHQASEARARSLRAQVEAVMTGGEPQRGAGRLAFKASAAPARSTPVLSSRDIEEWLASFQERPARESSGEAEGGAEPAAETPTTSRRRRTPPQA